MDLRLEITGGTISPSEAAAGASPSSPPGPAAPRHSPPSPQQQQQQQRMGPSQPGTPAGTVSDSGAATKGSRSVAGSTRSITSSAAASAVTYAALVCSGSRAPHVPECACGGRGTGSTDGQSRQL